MNRQRLLLIAAALVMCIAAVHPDCAARVATGTTAHDICSEAFISGQQPEVIFAETIASRPGLNWIALLTTYRVDRAQREVSASLAWMFTSRAVYRDAWG